MLLQNMKIDKFGIHAVNVNIDDIKDIKSPEQLRDEIPTLNRCGYMKKDLGIICKEFIKYALETKEQVLELGCAYGFVVQHVLAGDGKIVASDLEEKHLSVLLNTTPQDKLENLHVMQGRFPAEIDFPKESFNAVLSSRMFHFLEGADIDAGLKKVHAWLKPGGKFFFTGVSPYNYTLRDNFLTTYLQRKEDKVEWPGEVKDFNSRAVDHKEYLQNFIHVFDREHLEELLPKYGFEIDEIKLFDYPNSIDSNNEGHIGFIATKI